MPARETIRQIQTLLGTEPDGLAVPGGETDRAWDRLMATAPGAPWPPVAGAGFAGDYSAALRDEYTRLYSALTVREDWQERAVQRVQAIAANRGRYGAVADRLVQQGGGLPMYADSIWMFIGIVHSLEGDLDFSTHLANGDPLTSRTTHVPAGLPRDGSPPFTWEQGAVAALLLKKLDQLGDWSLPMMLYQFERYNGFGYRKYHPEVLSPYLWSGSTDYRVGKYEDDGEYNAELASSQIGAAVLLHAFGYRA